MKNIILKKLTEEYKKLNLNYKLPVILGVNENGKTEFADLADLKHILMAGTTGSGKSVFMNTMISTFLTTFSTHQLRLFLVDMKRVELLDYNGLPYLLSPVVVDLKKVSAGLDWLIFEKNRRLRIVAQEESYLEKLPAILVIIDTFSDLIYSDSVKFQDYLSKLMDQASDVKIHVVMSDSRTGSDVFTPLIRKLFPTKICFNVSESSYSKLIIGKAGGEKLRGAGDMLFLPPGEKEPKRIQAPYISDDEINKLIKSIPPDNELNKWIKFLRSPKDKSKKDYENN